ncbi:coniferyl aldehyde dehydrogenase [Endozoicomonas montiporae]|uniref:Aldehyde dehydrogenase n=1 Tax=Endozoicomonas montiporae TaxID=1027273 RepID=A0A081N2F5_9GAMM|nr:coniferyl aldehyde dehydrogenase [Endozoicomonas montiporae]
MTGIPALDTESTLTGLLHKQRKAFLQNPCPSASERRGWLQQLKQALLNHKEELIQAIDADFGGRSRNETLIAEFMSSLGDIAYGSKHLKKWMKPSRRSVPLHLQPASAKVLYQPVGVVGIIVPWNYPLFLAMGPLVAALSAGNRCMLKLSEFTPETSKLTTEIIAKTFPEDLITVVNGEADVAAAFSKLPFDHLLFTGSTSVGKHVMRAAADNLTPVTLELGGKSPVLVDNDFPLQEAVERICYGKSLNAGQTCVAPDYILIEKSQQQAFIDAYIKAFRTMYPTVSGNPDYSAIINERQHERLQSLIQDAKDKGATVVTLDDESITDGSRRMPPHLIVNATDDMEVMQQEIFGPLLPVIAIENLNEGIEFIRARPRPLALYYFGSSKERQEQVQQATHSGGVCINETLMHVAIDDMPFGGIGPSGMGHYHGHEGFLTFSKAKSVLSKGRFNSAKLVFPPHNTKLKKAILKFISS